MYFLKTNRQIHLIPSKLPYIFSDGIIRNYHYFLPALCLIIPFKITVMMIITAQHKGETHFSFHQ
jgi:hypothetical protein